jgi:hypothetical protein
MARAEPSNVDLHRGDGRRYQYGAAPYRRLYSSIKMMVGSAFFDLNIVAVGIVRNVSIIILAKLSNTINGKYASSMKLLLRTPCVSHLEFSSDARSQI